MAGQTTVTTDSTGDVVEERNISDQVHLILDRIARLAYQFYEDRGRQNGHDLEDWLVAEKVVRTATDAGPERLTGART